LGQILIIALQPYMPPPSVPAPSPEVIVEKVISCAATNTPVRADCVGQQKMPRSRSVGGAMSLIRHQKTPTCGFPSLLGSVFAVSEEHDLHGHIIPESPGDWSVKS
jgi:hypothetical protein